MIFRVYIFKILLLQLAFIMLFTYSVYEFLCIYTYRHILIRRAYLIKYFTFVANHLYAWASWGMSVLCSTPVPSMGRRIDGNIKTAKQTDRNKLLEASEWPWETQVQVFKFGEKNVLRHSLILFFFKLNMHRKNSK